MLETVNADADRVTRLITELLDVSRIESGRMEVHRQLVDLADRARKIIAGRVASGDAEDRFRLEVRHGVPETWLDADKIDQILGNLVENAVRHGAGIVTIVVEPAHLDDLSQLASTPQLAGPGRLGSAARTGGTAAPRPGAPDAASVSVRDQGEVPALACTSSRAWSRRTAVRSASAEPPAAAPSFDLSCPRGLPRPESDALTATRQGSVR